jgi:hypothetical protein
VLIVAAVLVVRERARKDRECATPDCWLLLRLLLLLLLLRYAVGITFSRVGLYKGKYKGKFCVHVFCGSASCRANQP